ncbi:MAG: type II 3-dehydroquinate dehydratase [Gammaproteobacteria bacterium]|nr:type II 3-dehydroquinate dehydratase [Gammaproteobacteria bacterium]MAW49019.1 type II 3-dehydroquinate dehydratase [Gammaproteobacteria bacterium]|tara:strand:+ start:203 stop:649 length:447 start_codon:yes stop_codon:yes gene_type:complete
MSKILILNGPNLNLLGEREPEIYGYESLDDISEGLNEVATEIGVELNHQQFNSEAELITEIHTAKKDKVDFIIFNPGAFTHTSIALRDALLGVSVPFIEIHISNVFAREDFRKKSYLSDIAVGVISGHGIFGYELALMSAYNIISKGK